MSGTECLLDKAVSATLEMESYKGIKARSTVPHVEVDPRKDDPSLALGSEAEHMHGRNRANDARSRESIGEARS